MNCIDVHRKLITEPNNRDDAVNAHLSECSACANFAESVKQFDRSIHNATSINVPDGLAERILLKQSFKQQHRLRANRFKFYAIAASVILIFGVSFNFNNSPWQKESLEDATINHVANEAKHLSEENNVQLAKLNNMLQPFNIKLNNTIGQVNYAGTCPIRNLRGVHIILRAGNETATLLVMPGEYISKRTSRTKGNFKTTIVPTKNGSIAIVTPRNSKAGLEKSIENKLNQAIQYI